MALVMSFEDYVSQYGTITLTHSGGGSSAVAAGYSLNSLKTRQLGNVCRITRSGLGSTIIRVDFSVNITDPFVSALCNLDNQSGDDNFVVFKTFQTTTPRTTSSTLGGEYERYFQLVIGDLHIAPTGLINRLEVWITGGGSSEDLDIGRIWYGPAFQSYRSSGLAMDTGPEDSGGVELSRGGQAYPRIGVVSRTVNIPTPVLEGKEVFGSAYAGSVGEKSTVYLESGVHSVGKTGAFVAFQENETNPMRPVYGHFVEMPRFTAIAGGLFESSLAMREEK